MQPVILKYMQVGRIPNTDLTLRLKEKQRTKFNFNKHVFKKKSENDVLYLNLVFAVANHVYI